MKERSRVVIISTLAAMMLAVGFVSPASAWGTKWFAGNDCSGYSVSTNVNNQAGANTVRYSGTGTLTVSFRGDGHTHINEMSVSGATTVVRTYAPHDLVTYDRITGGVHTCKSITQNT